MRVHWALAASAALFGSACLDQGDASDVDFDPNRANVGTSDSTAGVVAVLVGKDDGIAPCTGTVIERNVVLTAAHCVEGANWVEIYQGDTFPIPYASGTGIAGQVLADSEWDAATRTASNPTNDATEGHDLALIVAGSDLNVTPLPVSFERVTSASLGGVPIRSVGYGLDGNNENRGTKRSATTRVRSVKSNHIEVDPVVCDGDSGGPLLANLDGREVIIGVSAFSDGPVNALCKDNVSSYINRTDTEAAFLRWGLENLAQKGILAAPFSNHRSPPFSDLVVVDGEQRLVELALGEIMALHAASIIGGYRDGSFRPQQSITRAELAAVLAAAFTSGTGASSSFSDVPPDSWAKPAIDAVVSAGFMRGYADGTFKPAANVTRQEVLVALASGLRLPAGDFARVAADYIDDAAVPEWARAGVAAAHDAGLLHNVLLTRAASAEGLELRPTTDATRAEAVSFIWQGYQRQGAEAYPCRFRFGCTTN